jgi:hypothetical protein
MGSADPVVRSVARNWEGPYLDPGCIQTREFGKVVILKRILKRVAIGAFVLIAVLVARVWHQSFLLPSADLLALPDSLIALESIAGQALIAESRYITDYKPLTANFVPQSRPAFCGVAASVVVLNALEVTESQFTQATFFTDEAREIRSPLRVTFAGMSLVQLRDLLRAHGLDVRLVHASDSDVDAFRTLAVTNLETAGDFLLANYQRAKLGQERVGHISPIAAYHAASDRFLLLDVAAHKYPPVWVTTAALWSAMNTVDSSENRTRGFIIVSHGKAPKTAPRAKEVSGI